MANPHCTWDSTNGRSWLSRLRLAIGNCFQCSFAPVVSPDDGEYPSADACTPPLRAFTWPDGIFPSPRSGRLGGKCPPRGDPSARWFVGGMSSSWNRMRFAGALLSIFVMVARTALNHKLAVMFWHYSGICKSEAPCCLRKASMCRNMVTLAGTTGTTVYKIKSKQLSYGYYSIQNSTWELHWIWLRTKLKSPRECIERAVAAATSSMFNSQGMKLISGSTSRVCLMRSCASFIEGRRCLLLMGGCGGILITLLRCE